MADDINGMQANMGLSGVYSAPQGMSTPSPADTSLRLSMEAAQRMQHSQRVLSSVPLGAPQALQQQFQQQMYQIQTQQSMNPYAAQALSHSQPGGAQQYLPSPITMTPPSSGVFRPPASRPGMAPVAPVYTPSPFSGPFAPQAPTPMFGSAYDQQIQQRDIRANQTYAAASHIPGAMGYGAGIMAGVGAGAAVGSRFGGWGAMAGGIIGGGAAMFSGMASGAGNLADMTMGPSRQRHMMGAGLQNMSQNWVTSGSDMSGLGRGLSRDASLNLAGQIQDMAGNSKFQKQTGGMFNSQDLMQITRKGGEAGLFDMSQEVPKIKQKLRETVGTIKQFMELTNDPSVTSVIQQMGRLQQFGLNQQEMVTAAQGMRNYSRMAGTTIDGLQQIGGLPGAATFQAAGLTAGQGFQHGNFAAGMANQMVASGSLTERQLALAGGKQGFAQREMQTQAAFAAMPLYAASQSRYSQGSWGIDPSTAGRGGGGAFGMVNNSMQAMNEAVNKGGVGALAMFQMKQKELSDTVLSSMSPMQKLKQRMEMAMSTGQSMGLSGEQALAVGAMPIVGMEGANQMTQMAKSPQFWENQRIAVRQRKLQLGIETAERNRESAGESDGQLSRALGFSGAGSWGRATSNAFGDIGASFSGAAEGISNAVGKGWNEHIMGTDVITSRFDTGVSGIKELARSGDKAAFARMNARLNKRGGRKMAGGMSYDQDLLLAAAKNQNYTGVAMGENVANTLSAVLPIPVGDLGTFASGAMTQLTTPQDSQDSMARQELMESDRFLKIMESSKLDAGSKKKFQSALTSFKTAMGDKGKDLELDAMNRFSTLLDKNIQGDFTEEITMGATGALIGSIFGPLGTAAGGAIGAYMGSKVGVKRPSAGEIKELAISAMVGSTKAGGTPMTRKEAAAKYAKMSQVEKDNLLSQGIAKARENSNDKSKYDGLEGAIRKGRADQRENATNQRIDTLKDNNYDRIETKLGLDPVGLDFFGVYSGGAKRVQKLAAKAGDEFGAVALLAAQKAKAGDEDTLTAQIKASGMTPERQQEILKDFKNSEKYSEEDLALLADVGVTGASAKDISSYGATRQDLETQSAFGSAGYMDSIGKYSPTMGSYIGGSGDEAITAKGIASQFTKENLAQMAKYGGVAGRKDAKIIERAQYKGTDKKKQRQALEAQALMLEDAALKATQDESGTEVQSKVSAEGDEAKTLDKDLKAIDQMAAMFADFKPSIKEFAKGTSDLSAAMESDAITRILEGKV